MSAEKKDNKNNCIEALRGGAILLIAVYHLLYKFTSSMADDWAGLYLLKKLPLVNHWGEIGVAIFLVITSYLLYSSKEQKHFKISDYYKSKLIRLWPTYFLAVTFTYFVTKVITYPNYERTVLDFFLNITWINGFVNAPYIDGAHWYMTVLVSLIAVNGLIRKLKIDKRIETYILWVSIAGTAKLVSQLLAKKGILSYFALISAGIYKVLGGGYIGIAAMGILYHIIRDEHYSLSKNEAWKCIILVVISSAYTIVATNVWRLIFTFFSIVLLELCLRKGNKPFKSRWAILAGAISYSFYLIHQQLGYVIEYQLSSNSGQYSIIFFVLSILIAFIVSLMIYALVRTVENRILIRSPKG